MQIDRQGDKREENTHRRRTRRKRTQDKNNGIINCKLATDKVTLEYAQKNNVCYIVNDGYKFMA
jgi:hypothetical protein